MLLRIINEKWRAQAEHTVSSCTILTSTVFYVRAEAAAVYFAIKEFSFLPEWAPG